MPEAPRDKFVSRLVGSQGAINAVATWAQGKGKVVQLGSVAVAPDYEHWDEYTDSGDLFIDGKRVEVKGQRYTWERCWPFRDLLVCAAHSFDRAEPKPEWYIYLNADFTWGAFLCVADCRSGWWQQPYRDKEYGDDYEQIGYWTDPKWLQYRRLKCAVANP